MAERSAVASSEIAVKSDYGRIEAVPSRGYSSVVGRPLHKGHAWAFFNREVQEAFAVAHRELMEHYGSLREAGELSGLSGLPGLTQIITRK